MRPEIEFVSILKNKHSNVHARVLKKESLSSLICIGGV